MNTSKGLSVVIAKHMDTQALYINNEYICEDERLSVEDVLREIMSRDGYISSCIFKIVDHEWFTEVQRYIFPQNLEDIKSFKVF